MPKERSKLLPERGRRLVAGRELQLPNIDARKERAEPSQHGRVDIAECDAALLPLRRALAARGARRWHALTPGCRIEPLGCHCFHVAGSMLKAKNPMGYKRYDQRT